jgi:hypothetical protein
LASSRFGSVRDHILLSHHNNNLANHSGTEETTGPSLNTTLSRKCVRRSHAMLPATCFAHVSEDTSNTNQHGPTPPSINTPIGNSPPGPNGSHTLTSKRNHSSLVVTNSFSLSVEAYLTSNLETLTIIAVMETQFFPDGKNMIHRHDNHRREEHGKTSAPNGQSPIGLHPPSSHMPT